MKTIVFAGPSVFGLDLSLFPDIEFRPPAAAGDILAAVRDNADAIGLIDGFYGDCAAVWHKEILHALSKGIPVIGAASMGALRAAECEPFGMIGMGEVFRAYQSGLRTSDADVAIVHAPAELRYRPLTIALVDAEATIRTINSPGRDEFDRLMTAARTQHFSSRTWRSIAAKAGFAPDFAGRLAGNAVSVKQVDAMQLLTALRGGDFAQAVQPQWKFQNTLFFQNLIARAGG